MKVIFLFLIFEYIYSYIPSEAIKYAKKWCKNYNPAYNTYGLDEKEDVNFVSQCLFEGGESLSGCKNRDDKGMVFNYNDFLSCLESKGWHQIRTRDDRIKKGSPILLYGNRHPMFAIDFEGDKTIYCGHKSDECEARLDNSKLIFLYKEQNGKK